MPAQNAIVVENTFINGLVTEATGLNFPDAAVTETYDCEFSMDGSVQRRPGFDFEDTYAEKTINRNAKVISTYLWQNVSGDGDVTVVVQQVGDTLYFYRTDGTGNFSIGAIADTITLTPVSAGPPTDTIEAQYTDGNGFLIVTHPYIDPIRISYDISSDTVSSEVITIMIRDFEGSADSYAVDERPTATLAGLAATHKYNLYNQGWTTTNLTAWDTAQTTMPSNADVMWLFVDASDNFDATTTAIARVHSGNTPAVKGHYILELADQDRQTASGISGVSSTNTSFYRPSISAFFAGRVFYSGITYPGFNSNIYFTQIIERPDQYGAAYQVNDPTSAELFDLLPSDGGVISIPEAGSIMKLISVPGGLAVFAANGIWFVTGSTGIGFTATDSSVQKITSTPALTHTSFVIVAGYPCWWNAEGIYIMTANSNSNLPQVQSISSERIQSFYDEIPMSSKRLARGFYQPTEGHIRWIYKSTSASSLTDLYEYDRVLNFNVRTKAWYPWTIGTSDVKVNSLISSELVTRPVTLLNVSELDLTDLIIDSSGNQVVTFTESGTVQLQYDKYLVSYLDSGSYKFTFADRKDNSYVDWASYPTGSINYISYLITGFKLRGQALRKFQSNWVRVFSRVDEAVRYYFQGIWDFALTGSGTGRWSAKQSVDQQVTHNNIDYGTASKRLKVRGHGLALQFKLTSADGEPFDIIGWSSLQSTNEAP